MKKTILLSSILLTIVGCNGADNQQPLSTDSIALKGSLSELDASSDSPSGVTCQKTVREPISRGRGHGLEGKYEETTYYYAGFIRGDVNQDGVVNKDDAHLATKRMFKPENFECPAVADVGGYPQTYESDGFFTSQDIYVFKEFRKTGVITWNQDIICEFDCAIPNHMDPKQ